MTNFTALLRLLTENHEIVGGGGYDRLLADTIKIEVAGVTCQCLAIERLIEVKRAEGRPKDLEAIAELEQILREMQREV